jgi:hypothetical protein
MSGLGMRLLESLAPYKLPICILTFYMRNVKPGPVCLPRTPALLALTEAPNRYYYISGRMSGLCLGLFACLAPLLALTGAPILYYDKVFHIIFIITCVFVIAMDAVDKKVSYYKIQK